jgi:TRAP-type C4-dicarboxylate transport system substrate-binding protein
VLAGEGRRLRGLCYLDAGSRSFYTRSKPILAPSDLRGMKIRVMNSRTTMRMVHEMGAAPTPISFGEVYTALQQGTVDGAENNAPTFVTSRHCEVCKHFSLDEHARIPDLLLIGVDVWRALSPDTRRWLQAAATETSGFHREAWMKKTAECLAECEAQGVTIHRPDKAPFLASVEAMLKDYAGPPLGRWIARVREAR